MAKDAVPRPPVQEAEEVLREARVPGNGGYIGIEPDVRLQIGSNTQVGIEPEIRLKVLLPTWVPVETFDDDCGQTFEHKTFQNDKTARLRPFYLRDRLLSANQS
jgi:hypothetical protein